ncbi:MAG: PAS domain-containing protein [bacterium]|nr:PAS domain-containing protein [bacterium]
MTQQNQSSRIAGIQLEQLYNHAPVGLAFMDTELRFVRINERLAAINGPSVEAHIGRTLSEIIPEIAPTIEPIYRRVMETGEPRLAFEVRGKTASVPPKDLIAIVSYLPLIADGRVLGAHTVVQDVTESRNLQEVLLKVAEREQRGASDRSFTM